MKEIEVKILEIDVTETIRKIEEFGGVKTYEGEVITTYYDSREKLHKQGRVLRLRRKDGSTEITLKQKTPHTTLGTSESYLRQVTSPDIYKVMEEVETTVGDYKTMDTILRGIGFKPCRELTKRRTSYSIGEVHFDIDTYNEFPTFLEIEAKTGDLVKEWVLKLGYTMNDAKPWTTSDVFKHYGKEM